MTRAEKGTGWAGRVNAVDWDSVNAELEQYGCALTGPLLSQEEAAQIAAMYPDDSRFPSTIDMGRHRFGEGAYRYFAEPFPDAVVALRADRQLSHAGIPGGQPGGGPRGRQ
jgi:hypothetical protein